MIYVLYFSIFRKTKIFIITPTLNLKWRLYFVVPETSNVEKENEQILAPLRELVKEHGDLVRNLKATGKSELEIKKAVSELKTKKKALEEKELEMRYLIFYLSLNSIEAYFDFWFKPTF